MEVLCLWQHWMQRRQLHMHVNNSHINSRFQAEVNYNRTNIIRLDCFLLVSNLSSEFF